MDIKEIRKWFATSLKKVYGFGDYGVSSIASAATSHPDSYGFAPYTHHQHQQFLFKFNHYFNGKMETLSASFDALMNQITGRVLSDS